MGAVDAVKQRREERQREERYAGVDGQAQRIDEEDVDHRAHIDRVGDDYSVYESEDRQRGEGGACRSLERDAVVFAEVVDEYQRGDGQQVEDVHAYRQSHEVGYEHYPAR